MSLHRLHPALLVHPAWIAGRRRLIAQASASRPPLILNDPRALTALAALPPEFDREAASAAWRSRGIPEAAHPELWAGLADAGVLTDASENGAAWWDEFGWREARAYHEATRDYPFIQMDRPQGFRADNERMHEYLGEAPPPPVYQHAGGGTAIELPRAAANESADEWLQRLTAEERKARDGVGLLLDVCFGERAKVTVSDGTSFLHKSIPSGGARHPTEVFLGVFDLDGIDPGIYHYDVEHHGLERIREGQHRDGFRGVTLDLFAHYETPPAAALVFTSLVERAMWRYRDPRSFRAIPLDVGHAVMAFQQVARMLGFRTCAYQEMRDREVAELMRVDPVAQPPLFVASLVP